MMNRRHFRLAPVLRARQAQEDAAKGGLVRARASERDAQDLAKRASLDLVGAGAPTEGTARAIVAALVARQALAANLAAAEAKVVEAGDYTALQQQLLADAAKKRRAVERLAERHAEARKAHEMASDQKTIDELAVTNGQRASARGASA
jgi:flagellar protein FliJ